MSTTADLTKLAIDDFAPHQGATFNMNVTGGVVPLRLAKVDSSGGGQRPGGAFSLLFVAPAGRWWPQAIYQVIHPALGAMEIFMVPIGPLDGGNGYEAIFI
jgi:hypothetical protein